MMVNEDGTPYDAPLSEHARKRYERSMKRAEERVAKMSKEELDELKKSTEEILRQIELHPEKILYGK